MLKHEKLYRGKVIELVVDTMEHPSGRTAIREVVLRPCGVVAIPVLPDGRLLLICQFRYPLKRHMLW